MIKALAFDMDGTLLNKKHKVSERTKEAIQAARVAGYEIILASGRSPLRMEKIAADLGVD
jgi:HAD superfamily hydrolase (TIGR01484 family)